MGCLHGFTTDSHQENLRVEVGAVEKAALRAPFTFLVFLFVGAHPISAQVNEHVGYGWFLRERDGRRVSYYNGNTPGVSGYFALYPDEDLCVVVLANHDIPRATSIGQDIAAAVFNEEYRVPIPLETIPFSASENGLDYVGSYEFAPDYGFDITIEGDALLARIAWPRYPATLIPVGRDRFFHRYFWNTLVFVRNSDGEIESLHWASAPESLARRVR